MPHRMVVNMNRIEQPSISPRPRQASHKVKPKTKNRYEKPHDFEEEEKLSPEELAKRSLAKDLMPMDDFINLLE